MIQEFNDRLRAAFTSASDRPLIRAVREGILMADDLVDNAPLLKTPVGRDLHGHIRRAAIMYRVEDCCRRGDLPFVAEMSRMPKGSWHWLEITSADVRAHICRTGGVGEFPEDTPNRQDARLTNQIDLFSYQRGITPIETMLEQVPELYAWLMFGVDDAGKLAHLCWGAPDAKTEDWLGHINILAEIARSPETEEIKPATPNAKDKLRFKQHIEEALEDKDKNKKA